MGKTVKIADIAKKNLKRNLFRSIIMALSVTAVSASLFSITTIIVSVEQSLEKGVARLGADIMVVPVDAESKAKTALLAGKPSVFYMDKSVEEKVRNVKGVKKAASQIFLKTAEIEDCCEVFNMLLIGFDPENDLTIIPWLYKNLKRPLSGNEVIVGTTTEGYILDDTVKLYGTDFKIAGMLEETGMMFIDNSTFIPVKALRRIVEGSKKRDVKTVRLRANKISTVLVRVVPGVSPTRVAVFIEHDIPGVKAIVSQQVISSAKRQLLMVLRSILIISIVFWIMALLLNGVVFSIIANERRREIGLLRSMGARQMDIFRLIMAEASTLSLVGGTVGIICGGALLYFLKGFIRASVNIPYLWPSATDFAVITGMCLVLSFITGTVAALYPAIRSMKMEPYEAIRRGE